MNRRAVAVAATVAMAASVCAACGSSSSSSQTSSSAATSTTAPTSSASFPSQVQQQLQQVVTVLQQRYGVPGAAVAVTVPGQGSWVGAYGVANTANNQPLSLNHKFLIQSVTKTFTATVILQLVQQGKLSLSDPISKWVPNIRNGSAITVQMLLNMTSGIYDVGTPGSPFAAQVASNPAMVWSPQQLVSIAAQGQSQPPGQFSYSDTNYAILGIIAQAVTGQPIGSLITSQVIQPLHLNNTSYPTTRAIPPPATTGYVGGPGGQLVATPIYDPSATDGSGAMISTLGDLQVWAKALATGSLLSPATQQQRLQLGPTGLTFSPLPGTTASAGIAVQYGLGVMGYGGMLGHNGLGDGYNAEMFYLPAKNATVVVLLNGLGTFTGPGGQESLGDGAVVSIAQIALSGAVATSPAPSTAPSQRRAF